MRKVNTLIVDKTGTLTEGKPKLSRVVAFGGLAESEVLALAASLEQVSEHPLGASIVAAAKEKNLELTRVDSFQSFTGKGVTGEVQGRRVSLGNLSLLSDVGVEPGTSLNLAEEFRTQGQTVVFVIVEEKLAGIVCVEDPIKESASVRLSNSSRGIGL